LRGADAGPFTRESELQYNGGAQLSMSDFPSNPAAASERSSDEGVRQPARSPAEDMELLSRVQARDQGAMAEIFDRYSGMAFSVAMRVLRDPSQAEDVMQDVFFRLWQNPGAFTSERGSLGGWLAVVVRNRAIDIVRRRRPSDPVEDVVLPANTNLAAEVERNTLMERVRGVLTGLPAEQRKTLEMAYFDGLSHTEIAAKTGEPLGTVKTRIRSALITVRKAFQA
jgi:RNA polymerase sigma-70 factor (ECF subfamily)